VGGLWLSGLAGALVLYVLTLAPDLVWQDSGDYQYEAARLDFSRPGDAVRVHPWFLVAAHVLGSVPLWNYAYAANLASAIGTALAAANVLVLARLVTGRTWPGVLAAVSFAVGQAVWAHAAMAETYGWAAAFLSAECLCAWAYLARRQARWLLLLFLLNGIAISNHLLAVLSLAVFAVWTLYECIRRRTPWRVVPAGAGCWLAGGTLYWIVVGMEYARTASVAQTLRSALVGRWGGAIFNMADLAALLGKSVLYVGLNYPTPLIAAGFIGAWVLVRRRDAFARLLVVLAAVYFVWAARYKVADQYAFFIPFYVFGSVLIGVGAAWILERARPRIAWAILAAALVPVAVYAVLPDVAERASLISFPRRLPYRNPYTFFLQPWRTGDWSARRFAQKTLDAMPPRAVLIPDSTSEPPLVCLQKLEGRRPDVLIAYTHGAPRDVVAHYWDADEDLLPEIRAEGRRVFVVSNGPDYMPRWVAEFTCRKPFGIVWEVEPCAKEGGA
jgi:hypothetical protein